MFAITGLRLDQYRLFADGIEVPMGSKRFDERSDHALFRTELVIPPDHREELGKLAELID